MNRLTVTIITKDEEENIARAINSVKDIANEIIVVDSGSRDKTLKIAKELGCKVYERQFDNFADQKNYAREKTTSEWVFSLDADEEVSPELASEIETVIQENKYDGFLIPRRNFILGGEIKHSRWSPDKHIWLWKKPSGKWIGKVHEEVVIKGKVGELKHAKLHYQDKSIFEFLDGLNRYSELEAHERYKDGIRFSFVKMVYDTKKSFVGRFFLKAGFRDGWRGFVLCTLRAIYHTIVWLKVLEIQKHK